MKNCYFSLSLGLWLIIAAFRNFIAMILKHPDLGVAISVAGICLTLTSFTTVQTALYQRDFNFRTLFLARITGVFIPVLITIPLAILGFHYWALIIGTICGNLWSAWILTVKSHWKIRFFYRYSILREMIGFSIWSLIDAIFIWITSWIDVVIVGNAFNDYYLGLYNNSIANVNAFLNIITTATAPVLLSALSRLQHNENEYIGVFFRFQAMVSLALIPMGTGLFLYRDLATGILFGSQWEEAALLVELWGLISTLLIVFSDFSSIIFVSKGKPQISFISQILYLCLFLPVLIFAVRYSFRTFVYIRVLTRFFLFFFLNIMITYVARQYYKILMLSVYKKSSSSKKIMIITTYDQAATVLKRMKSENIWEYQITYLTILDRHMVGQTIEGVEVKADIIDMYDVARCQVLDGVFIHIPNSFPLNLNLEELILNFENMGVIVNLSINTFGLKINEKIVQEMCGYYVLTFSSRLFSASQLHLKRLIDILVGLVGCVLTVILTIFIAPAIFIESPGPIFFSQVRVGKNGRRFRIYKFRSMYVDAEERKAELLALNEMNGYMFKMKNDPRVTKVGAFLRKTSLDEFPQFLNILKGDMSLVGTRPPTKDEFLQYEGRHKRRLALKSGLTGNWQVSRRSDITDFEEVVKLDLEYIDNWSLWMDFKILIKTVWIVIFGKGSR